MDKRNQLMVTVWLVFALVTGVRAKGKTPKDEKALTLIHRYKLPASIRGHFDQFTVDADGKRLFGTAVEDKKVVVIDLEKGVVTHEIGGIEEPRAVLYRPDLSRLYVSDGGGALHIIDSKTYQPIKTLKLLVDADPSRMTPLRSGSLW